MLTTNSRASKIASLIQFNNFILRNPKLINNKQNQMKISKASSTFRIQALTMSQIKPMKNTKNLKKKNSPNKGRRIVVKFFDLFLYFSF